MIDLLDIDDQIERNEKCYAFYYANYQKTQGRIAVLTLIYSVISIYIVQIIRHPFGHTSLSFTLLVYVLFLLVFLILLSISAINTYKFLEPKKVAYVNFPKYFYSDIRAQYENDMEDPDEATLNEYLKASYREHMESVVKEIHKLYKTKGRFYFLAFRYGIMALIVYLICTGFVIFNTKEEVSKTNIANFKEIVDYADSTNITNKHLLICQN